MVVLRLSYKFINGNKFGLIVLLVEVHDLFQELVFHCRRYILAPHKIAAKFRHHFQLQELVFRINLVLGSFVLFSLCHTLKIRKLS